MILVNSRMKILIYVLLSNHMPPRKQPFYKENHRMKRLRSAELPLAPSVIQSPPRLFSEEWACTQNQGSGAPVLAVLLITVKSQYFPFPCPQSALSASVSLICKMRNQTPSLRVLPAIPWVSVHCDDFLSAAAVIKTYADFVLIIHTLPFVLFTLD